MYRRKALRMVRIGLVAAMVVAPLMVVTPFMVSTGNAMAFSPTEMGLGDPGTEYDEFESVAWVYLILDIDENGYVSDPPTGYDIKTPGIPMTGLTKILRSAPNGTDGNEPLDWHVALRDAESEPDGYEDILTEMVRMELTSIGDQYTIRAGSEFGLPESIGAIEAKELGHVDPYFDGSREADSWFDIYFELTGTKWGTLTNRDPVHMAATITEIPPLFETYEAFEDTLMQDEFGFDRVLITHVSHIPGPPVVPVFPSMYFGVAAAFAVGILAYLLRRRLVHQN